MAAKRRVLLVFGTRPEAIKMAPVYGALRGASEEFDPICCVTAQHRGLLDQALASFGIVADIDLGLMQDGQEPGEVGARALAGLGPVLRQVQPALVLVHGDTTTTMAAALAAFYAGIAVGHVEAGLRSGTLREPFPEELNRRVASLVATHHFAPTQANRDNLLREGIPPSTIHVTGNTVVDALHRTSVRLDSDPTLAGGVNCELNDALDFDWRRERFVLVTCHRRESLGDGLAAICAAVAELAEAFPGVNFVLPIHPNPHVAEVVLALLGGHARVHLTSPFRYEALIALLRACHFVMTDSGGIQEEALSFRKPVLVMREVTERPEALAAGCARLVGVSAERIVPEAAYLLRDPSEHARMVAVSNPYGDGQAAARIVKALRR